MLFRPKHQPPWLARLRVALWPRRSWTRSARYVGWRVTRLAGSPHGLALGVATGVFMATLPIPGAQMFAAAVAAWMIGGNVPAALLGTFWANPLSLPVLWLSAHWVGSGLLGSPMLLNTGDLLVRLGQVKSALLAPGAATISAAYAVLWPVFKPLALGALPIAAVSAALFYWLTLHLIAGYRERRFEARGQAQVDQSRDADLTLGVLSGRLT
jgi:uncharacterized protein